MPIAEHFADAIASLPDAVRRRLDGAAPLDWPTLEDPGTARALDRAIGVDRRLPEPVEALVRRLVRDVGIVPEDLADGVERQGAAVAWRHRVSIEAEAGTYRLRDPRSGEIHGGIRASVVAGYAVLALQLARAVHEAGELWLHAGDRYRAAPPAALCPLARCAVRMSAQIRSAPGSRRGRPTTAELAGILETAWNAQDLRLRAELARAVRPGAAPDACAPRESRFAPAAGYRLHACDPGEIRWLRALAERAGRGAPSIEPKPALQAAPPEPPSPGAEDPPPDPDPRALGEAPTGLDRLIHAQQAPAPAPGGDSCPPG